MSALTQGFMTHHDDELQDLAAKITLAHGVHRRAVQVMVDAESRLDTLMDELAELMK